MRDESQRLTGVAVRPLPKRNRTWREDRVCAEEGCETRLSIYNRSKFCWTHEPTRTYILRGRKKSPQAA